MTFFGPDLRNGLPIGLGSVAGFGTTPRPFSPASLFTGGVNGAWFDPSDSTTLFSDRAGTTPCAAPGAGALVPVGLMLDKSQGLVLGSELANAATQTLSTATGTQSGAGWNITATGSFAILSQPSILAAGKWYKYTISWSGNTNGRTIRFYAGGSGGSNSIFTFGTAASGTGTVIVSGGTQNTSAYFQINDSVNGDTFYLEITSVRELPGNHAIAANDTTARPELSARVNLLTYSEQFDNAYWSKNGALPVTQNSIIAPDGTLTADTFTADSSFGQHNLQRGPISSPATSYTFKASLKYNNNRWVGVAIYDTSWKIAAFDVQNGAVGTAISANVTASIVNQGNGWYRCQITYAATGSPYVGIFLLPSDTTSFSWTPTGVEAVYVWGADLRVANIGTTIPAYQRVADQYTYDTVGFPRYLAANGTSSAMSTPNNVNLSGTDKVTVFAGVRKLSDAAAFITELSANVTINNGALALYQSGATVLYGQRGTVFVDEPSAASYAAPISVVATGVGNISGDVTTIRTNGIAVTDTSDLGTGNFGSYPLFIGSRNNASLWFNGSIYSLIVAGSAVSAGNITATEQWVAGKTGITI